MKIAMYLFLGLCAAAVAAYLLAPKLHRFAYWSEPKTAAELRALATGGWQLDWLEVEPGLRLAGLVRPPRDPAARWLLFVPGNSPTLLAGFRAELDRLRGDDDVGMALYAYRGFDGSGGTPTPAALVQDLVRQWDHLVQRGARRGRIEVWGYSLGAVLAPQLGAALAARGEAPARLVLAAAAPRITVMPAGRFGRFLPADVYDAGPALGRLPCPTVIVHGTDDDALPVEGAREVQRACGQGAVLHEVPGAGHLDLWPHLRRLCW